MKTLGKVALEYLKHIADLEAARALFVNERAQLLREIEESIKESHPEYQPQIDGDAGELEVQLDGEYAKARLARDNKKRTSGYRVIIGDHYGHVGAQALLWFGLRLNPAREQRLELPALLADTKGELIRDKSSFLVRTARFGIDEVDRDALIERVAQLPDLFARWDSQVATKY